MKCLSILQILIIQISILQTVKCIYLEDLVDDERLSNGLLKPVIDFVQRTNLEQSPIQCFRDLALLQKNFTNLWAAKMLDANGKLPPGILTGNLHTMGQFDECLSIEAFEGDQVRIKGKYCLALLPISSANTRFNRMSRFNIMNQKSNMSRIINQDSLGRTVLPWAVCLPASCNAEEIQKIIRLTLESLGLRPPSLLTVPEKYCQESKPVELSGGAIALIVVAGITLLILLLSTSYDLYCQRKKNGKNRRHKVMIAFSMYTNTKNLLKTSNSSSTLKCVHGIRVLSILWIMLGHRYTTAVVYPSLNTFAVLDWMETYPAMMIICGSVAVDTFFVLSGMLLSYVFFKQNKNERCFNPLSFYFHRIVRTWPAMAVMVFAHATIYDYISDGPYWRLTNELLWDFCKKWWWTALLYVQNYVNPLELCVGPLWFLSIDMQMYILAPILLLPLLVKPKLGVINMIFWIVVAQTINAAFVYTNDWAATAISATGDNDDYSKRYYTATHMRATPWLLGFAAGYVLFRVSHKKIKMNKILVITGWLLSLAVMAAIVFGFKELQSFSHKINKLEDGTFNAFARTGWGMAVIWIIFACVNGYGGIINWFLSLKIWEIFGRFTYAIYLIHFSVQYWQVSSAKVTTEFSHLYMVYSFFGDLVLTILFSYILILGFESPFIALEKALMGRAKPTEHSAKIKRDDEVKNAYQ